jgi:hypothetical protein
VEVKNLKLREVRPLADHVWGLIGKAFTQCEQARVISTVCETINPGHWRDVLAR